MKKMNKKIGIGATALALAFVLQGCGRKDGLVAVHIRGTGPQASSRASCPVSPLYVTFRGPGVKRGRVEIKDAYYTPSTYITNGTEGTIGDKFDGTLTVPDQTLLLPAGPERVISFVGKIIPSGSTCLADSNNQGESYPIYGESKATDLPVARTLTIPVGVDQTGLSATTAPQGTFTDSTAMAFGFQQVQFNFAATTATAGCSYTKMDVLDMTEDGDSFSMASPKYFIDIGDTGATTFNSAAGMYVRGLLPFRDYALKFSPDPSCSGKAFVLLYTTPRSDKQLGTSGTSGGHSATCKVTKVMPDVIAKLGLKTLACARAFAGREDLDY